MRLPFQTRHVKYAEMDANGTPSGFATPSRKVELYSETFLERGYPPLPEFTEPPVGPAAQPDLAAQFPLVLTSAKSPLFCQTRHRALPSLRQRAVRARARLNGNLDPRVVVGEHGWWQACSELDASGYDPFGPLGANFNLLIGSTLVDPASGTASHRSYLCEIQRATPV